MARARTTTRTIRQLDFIISRSLDAWSGQGRSLINVVNLLSNDRRGRSDLLDVRMDVHDEPQAGNRRAAVWWDMQEYCAWRRAMDEFYTSARVYPPHAVFVGLQQPDFWPGLPVPDRLAPLLDAPVVITSGPAQAYVVRTILGREVIGVRHAVDLEEFSPARERGKTILAVANWPDYYGLDRLDATGLDVRYVGKFNDGRGEVEENMPSAYHDAAVFVRVTRQEGNCLSRAEALACGVPQVGSEAGDAAEQISQNGVLLSQKQCDDADVLRSAIISVANASDGAWRAMSGRSRLLAQTFHHPRRVASEWMSVIKMLEEL